MIFLHKMMSTFFFIGIIKYAPGTFGSIAAIIIWYVFTVYELGSYFILFFIFFLITGFISVYFYLLTSNNKDPKEVVIDEVAGQSIPLIAIQSTSDVLIVVIAFIFFRFFDILKIYPINKIENLPGTFGVMLDDVAAGIYTLIIVIIYMNIF